MFVNYKGSYFFWMKAGRGKLEVLDGEKGNILFIMNVELGMN